MTNSSALLPSPEPPPKATASGKFSTLPLAALAICAMALAGVVGASQFGFFGADTTADQIGADRTAQIENTFKGDQLGLLSLDPEAADVFARVDASDVLPAPDRE